MRRNLLHIDSEYLQDFLVEISRFNMQRGKLFAAIIIGIELILLLIDLFSRSVNTIFKFDWYASMYIIMIAVTGCLWLIFSQLEHNFDQGLPNLKAVNLTAIIYITFLMSWGAAISLQDQVLYGNIVAFLINMLLGSFMFYLRKTHILIPQLVGACILMIGLPYFQPSHDILIGHYVNVSIFLVFSLFIARTNYANYVQNFMSQKLIEEKSILLTQINNNLVLEIQSRINTQKALELANKQLKEISSLDALTGIPNRRTLDESLKEYWIKVVSEQLPISIMMIDIDFFKFYNDTNGHLAGDQCLQAVAGVINKCRRNSEDFAARYGGEEFLFISTGISKEEALDLGEIIRAGIEALYLEHPFSSTSPYVTASVGINWLNPTNADSIRESINRADQAMYQAKQEGKNRVILAQ